MAIYNVVTVPPWSPVPDLFLYAYMVLFRYRWHIDGGNRFNTMVCKRAPQQQKQGYKSFGYRVV